MVTDFIHQKKAKNKNPGKNHIKMNTIDYTNYIFYYFLDDING